MKRSTIAIVLFVAAVAWPSAAGAQEEPLEIFDSSTGYDHVNQPPPGALSSADWCLAFSDLSLAGETIEVTATGPTGPVNGSGIVADNGSVRVRVGITEGGTYTITSIQALSSGRSVDPVEVDAVEVVFDPEIIDCATTLTLAPPPTTTTTTIAATTTIETTSSTPSTTVATTTTTAITAPPSQPPTPSDGLSMWWLLFGAGVGLSMLGLAAIMFPKLTMGTKDRCQRERDAVAQAQKDLKKAQVDHEALDKKRKEVSEEANRLSGSAHRAKLREERRIDSKRRSALNWIKTCKDLLAKSERALAACEKRPPSPPPPEDPRPPGPGTAPPPDGSGDHDQDEPCCKSGRWIGINVTTGGIVGFAGAQLGTIFMFCMDDFSKAGVFKWSGLRAGLGGGAEVGGSVIFVQGDAVHPQELVEPLKKVLSGFDLDVSIGFGWTKLLKAGYRGVRAGIRLSSLAGGITEAGKVVKAVKKAERAGGTAEAAEVAKNNIETLKKLAEHAADTASETGAKTANSTNQAGGTGVQIPVGVGMQAAFWWLKYARVSCVGWTGCESCDPEKYLTGR